MSETREDGMAALRRTCDNAERWIASRMNEPDDERALEDARALAGEIRRLERLLRGTLCAVEDTEADSADELLRLRDEARGVRAVERWVSHDDTMNLRITAHDERFMAQCEGIVHASAPTLAALGLALLTQGRVTL